jgi:hypothetical protein
MHKTGSTSIQHSLGGFEDSRFLYARLGDNPNHSLPMLSLFVSQPELHPLFQRKGAGAAAVSKYIEKTRTDLERAVVAANGRTLVISGEAISNFPRDALIRLRDDFQKRFEEVMFVGYVRSPAELMSSSFQEQVKVGAVDKFDLERHYPSYRLRLSKFDEVFGRERVHLWKFDIRSFPDGCAVRDFCQRLGIALPSARVVRLNDSLPRQTVTLLYTYYKLGPNGATAMPGPKLLKRLIAMGKEPFRISVDVIKPILDEHRADISWMEARLGQSLHEEIGDHQAGDVRNESDLLRTDPAVVGELLALLGDAAPPGVTGKNAEEVAQLVYALREARSKRLRSPASIGAYVGKRLAKVLRHLGRSIEIGFSMKRKRDSER